MKKTKVEKTCNVCGVKYEVHQYRLKKGLGLYCSVRCKMIDWSSKNEVWNKGLDISDPRVASLSSKHAATMKIRYDAGEIITWNKGLTKDTDERVAIAVVKQTEWRNTDSPEKELWRASLSAGQVKAHAAGKYPKKFTKPEKLTWSYLESLGYIVKHYHEKLDTDSPDTWYHNFPVGKFVADFGCVGKKAVIECNGCYVHHHDVTKCKGRTVKYAVDGNHGGWCKDNIPKDKRKYSYYERNEWKWAIVWECEAVVGDFHRIEKYIKG